VADGVAVWVGAGLDWVRLGDGECVGDGFRGGLARRCGATVSKPVPMGLPRFPYGDRVRSGGPGCPGRGVGRGDGRPCTDGDGDPAVGTGAPPPVIVADGVTRVPADRATATS